MPRAGIKMDLKEMAEKAHKHMFQPSGFSRVWALLQGWFKGGTGLNEYFPKRYPFLDCFIL
jgi:hypothetical protein